MIEVNTGFSQQFFPLFHHSMKIRFLKEKGLLQVVDKTLGDPLSKVYIKVYCSNDSKSGGSFFKDGYTDIHGLFDVFTSQSLNKLLVRFFIYFSVFFSIWV
jgi:hypothetical protein